MSAMVSQDTHFTVRSALSSPFTVLGLAALCAALVATALLLG